MRLSVLGACWAIATSAKSRSGAPSLPQPRRSGGLGFRPLVLKSMPKLGSCGVVEFASACTFCVPRSTNPLDGSNPSALTRINPNRRIRSEFSSVANAGLVSATKSGSFAGKVAMMRRIDGEVVALHVTRPARPAVAIELLVQEEPAALRDKLREIGRSGGRGRGIETERRCLRHPRSGPAGAGDDRTTCWARQHE